MIKFLLGLLASSSVRNIAKSLRKDPNSWRYLSHKPGSAMLEAANSLNIDKPELKDVVQIFHNSGEFCISRLRFKNSDMYGIALIRDLEGNPKITNLRPRDAKVMSEAIDYYMSLEEEVVAPDEEAQPTS